MGADFEADLARAAAWIEKNLRKLNEAISRVKQGRTKAFKEWFGDWEKVARFRAVRDAIMNMPVVAMLTGQEFQSDGVKLTDKVPAYRDGSYQGSVESPELGRVVLDKEGVQSSIGHGVGRLKAAAFYAVPDLIQKGRVFDRQKDWKGRGYDTAVIAAPISIGEKEYICEVVVSSVQIDRAFMCTKLK